MDDALVLFQFVANVEMNADLAVTNFSQLQTPETSRSGTDAKALRARASFCGSISCLLIRGSLSR